MSPQPTAILGRPGHWKVPPQLDPWGMGKLAPGHVASSQCPECLDAAAREAAAPRPASARKPDPAPVAAPALTPAPEWTLRLASWEVVLVALVGLGTAHYTPAQVVMAAWQLDPQRLGLRGFEHHPDARTVIARLSGTKGIVARGWARSTAGGRIVATDAGRRYVAALRGGR